MWSGEEEYKTSCSWGVLIDCCSMQLLSHSHEKCSTLQCFVTFYSLKMTHFCHLLPWVIHSRSAFNCRSTYVRCRLRCLGEPKVCRVRWPLICIHKTLLFSSPGEDEPICVVNLALDQTIFIPFQISLTAWPAFHPGGCSLLNFIQEKIDKNDQAIKLSLCRLYCLQ